jgi:ribosomal protein S21
MTNVRVAVRDGDVAQALRRLRKKVGYAGVLADLKKHEAYLSRGERRRIKHRRVLTRQHKAEKKAL